jgi:hypothetical protein
MIHHPDLSLYILLEETLANEQRKTAVHGIGFLGDRNCRDDAQLKGQFDADENNNMEIGSEREWCVS